MWYQFTFVSTADSLLVTDSLSITSSHTTENGQKETIGAKWKHHAHYYSVALGPSDCSNNSLTKSVRKNNPNARRSMKPPLAQRKYHSVTVKHCICHHHMCKEFSKSWWRHYSISPKITEQQELQSHATRATDCNEFISKGSFCPTLKALISAFLRYATPVTAAGNELL